MTMCSARHSTALRRRARRDPAPEYKPDDPLVAAREGDRTRAFDILEGREVWAATEADLHQSPESALAPVRVADGAFGVLALGPVMMERLSSASDRNLVAGIRSALIQTRSCARSPTLVRMIGPLQ